MIAAPQMEGCTVRAFENFILVFAFEPFKVLSRTAEKQRKQTKRRDQDDPNDNVEAPLLEPISSSHDIWSGMERAAVVGLRSGVTFRIVVQPSRVDGAETSVTLKGSTTSFDALPLPARSFLLPSTLSELSNQELVEMVVSQPTDWMDCLVEWRDRRSTLRLLSRLYYNGLFTLPRGKSIVLGLPNGVSRYVIDLRVPGIPWTHNKKLKKVLGRRCTSDPFDLSCPLRVRVNRDFRDTMIQAVKYHCEVKGSGTWITEDLINAMQLMSIGGSPDGVKLCAVELWDVSTSELLAGCLGFSLGCVYHDFTMFTSCRARSSYGSVCTKLLGHALQECGYKLWYWGFKVGYMEDFESRYCAKELDRREFYNVWCQERGELPVWPIDEFLNRGMGLVQGLDEAAGTVS